MERFYRSRLRSSHWVSFTVQVKETDLWVRAKEDLSQKVYDRVYHHRYGLETYLEQRPAFREALIPVPSDPAAPRVVKAMIRAAQAAGVGPMAAVAGAIAEMVGLDLLDEAGEIIIENGGDLFVAASEPVTVGIYAGASPLSGKVGICLPPSSNPRGICTSSGTVGHSLSFGRADAVTVLSPSAALSDAAATGAGNRVRNKKDIPSTLEWLQSIPEVQGAVIILGDRLGVWGDMEVTALS